MKRSKIYIARTSLLMEHNRYTVGTHIQDGFILSNFTNSIKDDLSIEVVFDLKNTFETKASPRYRGPWSKFGSKSFDINIKAIVITKRKTIHHSAIFRKFTNGMFTL
jgi:hypothetical protein